MREFRAWNKITKTMDYDFRLNSKGQVILPDCRYGEDIVLDECIVLEYTGLKDKNKKKIFEGDILKTKIGFGQVLYDEGDYVVNYPKICTELLHRQVYDYISEVIDNIYENPELLEEK